MCLSVRVYVICLSSCLSACLLVYLSVCLPVCVTFVVFTDCKSCRRPIFHKPRIYGSVRVWANAWDVFRRAPSRGGRGRQAAVDFVVCFGCSSIYFVCFFFLVLFFLERTRPAAKMRTPCLIYLSTTNDNEARSLLIPGCVQGAII